MRKYFVLLIFAMAAFLFVPPAHAQTLQNAKYSEYIFPLDTVTNTETVTFTAPQTLLGSYDYSWMVKCTILSGTGTSTCYLYDGVGSLSTKRLTFHVSTTGIDSTLVGEAYGALQKLTVTGVGTTSQKWQVALVYKKNE